MNEKNYENLGELEKIIFDYISESLEKKEYGIDLPEAYFKRDDYTGKGSVIFGGLAIECSLNRNGFICWHCSRQMERLIRMIDGLNEAIASDMMDLIKANEPELIKRRIKELEEEIRRLKGN